MVDDLKNNDIDVYDNFFLEKDFKDFEDHIVYNGDFPWFLAFDSGKTVHDDHNIIKSENVIEYLQFIHILLAADTGKPNSGYYRLFEEKLPYIMSKLKLNNIEVLRAKLNLQTQFTNNKPHFHNTPHIVKVKRRSRATSLRFPKRYYRLLPKRHELSVRVWVSQNPFQV